MQVSLPSETATGTCFLGLYIQSILALQRKSGARRLPLAIMTSDETHTATLDLLKKNKYFGASARQVTLIKQGKVPCFADHAGHLATDDVDPYKLLLKPHGHGDVHNLLHTSGLAKAWWQQGFKWVAFFQDTNALVFRGLVPSLGTRFVLHCHGSNLSMRSMPIGPLIVALQHSISLPRSRSNLAEVLWTTIDICKHV
jgi:UDP-sugar pyrophosphorylase